MTAWLNGRLVESEAAMVLANDRGFTLGDGLFETLRLQDGVPLFFERHWSRLMQGAALLAIPVTLSARQVREAIGQLTAGSEGDRAIRITLTRGPAPRGVMPPAEPVPTWLITEGPLPAMRPVDLVTAHITRRNEHSPLAGIKSLNYLDNILALKEAAARGAGDALLLNTAGRVAEATSANCFFEVDGQVVTPPLADGALPGITRAVLLERGAAVEASLDPTDLFRVTAGVLSNSLGLRPVNRLDGRVLGDASRALTELCRGVINP